jgi:hypothetical protein
LINTATKLLLSDILPQHCFRTIRSFRDLIPGWFELIPNADLPPLDEDTAGLIIENQCPLCEQDGFFHDRERSFVPAYSQLPLDDRQLGATWERFGNSNRTPGNGMVQRVSLPLLCASRAMVNALLELHNDVLSFIPVRQSER